MPRRNASKHKSARKEHSGPQAMSTCLFMMRIHGAPGERCTSVVRAAWAADKLICAPLTPAMAAGAAPAPAALQTRRRSSSAIAVAKARAWGRGASRRCCAMASPLFPAPPPSRMALLRPFTRALPACLPGASSKAGNGGWSCL
jgi:hypothetical protein